MPNATIMGMGPRTRLPQIPLRTRGLFIDAATPLDLVVAGTDRTGLGATYMDQGAITQGTLVLIDCDSTDDFSDQRIALTQRDQLPFTQYLEIVCQGDIDGATLQGYLDDVERLTTSAMLARGLTVEVSGNLDLAAQSTSVGAGTGIAAAIGLLEDGLAERIGNGRGTILVPLLLLAAAITAGGVEVDSASPTNLFSPAGHVVVSDAGHQDANLYGVGALGYSVTPARPLSGSGPWVDPDTNETKAGFSRTGLVAYNPAHAIRATVT
jgi:hypothetical protein